jgi:hypothetical protein
MVLGNKVTRPLAFVGDALFFLYKTGFRLRNLARRGATESKPMIADLARIAGATDWIARRKAEGTP